jgi:hypothetical protein
VSVSSNPGRSPRNEVIRALDGQPNALALYRGALRLLADSDNPAAVRLAAAGVRELMDELQGAAGFETTAPDLLPRVRRLANEWEVVRPAFAEGGEQADGFGQTLDAFFAWFDAQPSQRQQAVATFDRLDPAGRNAPPVVGEARAAAWMSFRRWFNDVLHGNLEASEAEFGLELGRLEALLLAWLSPRPFKDLDRIDALLKGAPPDG